MKSRALLVVINKIFMFSSVLKQKMILSVFSVAQKFKSFQNSCRGKWFHEAELRTGALLLLMIIFRFHFFFSRNQLWTVMEWRSRNRLTPSLSRVWGNPDRHIWPDFNAVSNVNFNSTGRFRWIFVAFLSWNLLFSAFLSLIHVIWSYKKWC